jgi:hypothetical protein
MILKFILTITTILIGVKTQEIPDIPNSCSGTPIEPSKRDDCIIKYNTDTQICCLLEVKSTTHTRRACIHIPFLGFKEDVIAVYKSRFNQTIVDLFCEPQKDGDYYPPNNDTNTPQKYPLEPGMRNTCSDMGNYRPNHPNNCTSFSNATVNCCYVKVPNLDGAMCAQSPKNLDIQAFKDSNKAVFGEVDFLCSAKSLYISFLLLVILLSLI